MTRVEVRDVRVFKSMAATHNFLRGLGPALLPHGSCAGTSNCWVVIGRPGASVLPYDRLLVNTTQKYPPTGSGITLGS